MPQKHPLLTLSVYIQQSKCEVLPSKLVMGITDDVPNYDKDKKIHTVTNNTITK